jgi:hypothetical protein
MKKNLIFFFISVLVPGCPTDYSIMGPLEPVGGGTARRLHANFDAFKFPTSELVQFRALVTPCIPHCEPVVCHLTGHRPGPDTFQSYGRRRRDLDDGTETQKDELEGVVVASAMHIVDNFPFHGKEMTSSAAEEAAEGWPAGCSLGSTGFPVSVAWIALLACQAVLLVAFVAVCCQRRRQSSDCRCCQEGGREESSSSSVYVTGSSLGLDNWAGPFGSLSKESL